MATANDMNTLYGDTSPRESHNDPASPRAAISGHAIYQHNPNNHDIVAAHSVRASPTSSTFKHGKRSRADSLSGAKMTLK